MRTYTLKGKDGKNMIAKVVKKLTTFFTVLSVLLLTKIMVVAADDYNIFEEIPKYVNPDVQKKATEAMSPLYAFFFFVIAILSTAIIIYTIVKIVLKTFSVKRGKDDFSKKWVMNTALVLCICLVFGGTTGFRLLGHAKTLFIDNAVDIVDTASQEKPVQGGNSQGNGQNPTPTPKK